MSKPEPLTATGRFHDPLGRRVVRSEDRPHPGERGAARYPDGDCQRCGCRYNLDTEDHDCKFTRTKPEPLTAEVKFDDTGWSGAIRDEAQEMRDWLAFAQQRLAGVPDPSVVDRLLEAGAAAERAKDPINEARVDMFATQLQETGRATVYPGDEQAVIVALRSTGISPFEVRAALSAEEPE